MSYRVETSPTGRAGCKETECKKHNIKIELGDLRFGVWVEYRDHGSWSYKHWGCVTGAQIKNMRDYLLDPKTGEYRWDALDGYDSGGAEKNSLEKHPDLQEKVRRVITQGFIDPEDWNGDPEMNKLGEKGTHTKENMKKMRDEKRNSKHEIDELEKQNEALMAEVAALRAAGGSTSKLDAGIANLEAEIEEKSSPSKKTAAPKKRVRAHDDETEEAKPAKKKRVSKAKKEEDTDEEKPRPTKKRRPRNSAKKEESESEELEDIPVKFEDDELEKTRRAKKSRTKKSVKKEEDDNATDVDAEVLPASSRRSRAKQSVVKKEENGDATEDNTQVIPVSSKRSQAKKRVVKKEENSEATEDDAEVIPAPSKRSAKKRVAKKEAAIKNEDNGDATENDADIIPALPKDPQSKKRVVKKEEALKQEQDELVALHARPKSNTQAEKGVKREDDTDDTTPTVKKEPVKRRGRKVANAKDEPLDEVDDKGLVQDSLNNVGIKSNPSANDGVKGEPIEVVTNIPNVPDIKYGALKSEGVKNEDLKDEDDVKNSIMKIEDEEMKVDLVDSLKKPSGRAKKEKAAAIPSASTRTSRNRKN